ncbi:MAG: hypothetical protein RMK51_12085 [Meiothermus sp.]|nr:hypothetical protein [Meiothermus sp.]MCS7067821.1 hypothetical protein [Meiothermus sp.]MDW8426664.1 hypothetical protein [Meiothermus sp.]
MLVMDAFEKTQDLPLGWVNQAFRLKARQHHALFETSIGRAVLNLQPAQHLVHLFAVSLGRSEILQ